MTDHWHAVAEIFTEARHLNGAQREAYLDSRCGDDPALREEVVSLLTHASNALGVLDDPPVQRNIDPALDNGAEPNEAAQWLIGQKIGRYTIESVLARGGMGVVYKARQDAPQRTVALKVLPRGLLSRHAIRRFHHEVAVLGFLQHRSIAQIYEAGTHDDGSGGVPYFAMEFVADAKSITQYAIDHRLSTRQRLELLEQVCEAVHHGHQKGVIHRDLKPANILVNERGEIKIIDFGVARAAETDITITTLQTAVGQIIGTLQYMSPEQCEGGQIDIDTRSDVYALGVVMYELLSGRPPYDVSTQSIPSATYTIREAEPPRLSAVQRTLRGDVEIIALKALAKDRERRYQSAGALAADIGRYLRGDPIEARPPTWATRACRWVSRHPYLGTAAACAMMVLGSIAISNAVLWYRWNQPDSISLINNGREARLLSVGGNILARWTQHYPGSIRLAELVDRPHSLGGGQLAVVGYTRVDGIGTVRAFDTDRTKVPIWEQSIDPAHMPPQLHDRGFDARNFRVEWGAAFDIFPEVAGEEIIAVFRVTTFTQAAIQILDLNGNLLYQTWHDGPIKGVHWIPESGVLVFCAVNGEAFWRAREPNVNLPIDTRPHPLVLFALRPEKGMITQQWLVTEPHQQGVQPVWYRCLKPASHYVHEPTLDLSESTVLETGRYVVCRLLLAVKSEAAGDNGRYRHSFIRWTMDGDGRILPEHTVFDDHYVRTNLSPDPAEFHFGELPPVRNAAGQIVDRRGLSSHAEAPVIGE